MCNPVDRDRFADSSPPPGGPVWVDRRWACAHPSRRIGAAYSCHAFGCAGVRCAGDPRVRRGSRAAQPAGVGSSIGRRGCDQSAQLGELAFAVVSGGQARLVWSCPPQGQGGQDGQCEEGDPSGHDRQSRGHGTSCTSAHIAYLDVPHYLDNTAPTPVDGRHAVTDQPSVSTTTGAPSAARCTDSQPFFAADLVSYPSPVATTCPLLALSRNRYFSARSW